MPEQVITLGDFSNDLQKLVTFCHEYLASIFEIGYKVIKGIFCGVIKECRYKRGENNVMVNSKELTGRVVL